jgi:PleD family two-component response regulator
MPPPLTRPRCLNEVADTDEYNWSQICRMATPHRTVLADAPDRPLRVLIVDDHRATADTLAMLVRAWGHEVECAYDGETGFALAVDFMPEVIFSTLSCHT